MKCLSLWQPWASLIAIGAKKIETRSWSTKYRGPLLIHASKRQDKDSLNLCSTEPFCSKLKDGGILRQSDLPLGVVVCRAILTDCVPTGSFAPEYPESYFGDYRFGRFAWLLSDVEPVEPFHVKGRQGLFDVPDDYVATHLRPPRQTCDKCYGSGEDEYDKSSYCQECEGLGIKK